MRENNSLRRRHNRSADARKSTDRSRAGARNCAFSFPGSAWERTACEALPRVWSSRQAEPVRSQARPGHEDFEAPSSKIQSGACTDAGEPNSAFFEYGINV